MRRPAAHVGALILSLLIAVAVTAGGCSDDPELDVAKLEAAVPAAVLEDHPELVTEVVCPDSVVAGQGVATLCFADIAGRPVELSVTQVDDDGTLRIQVDRTLLDVEDLATQIAHRLTTDVGVATSVVCDGPQVRVLEIGDELRCDAVDPDDRSRTFVATILDDEANYSLQID